MNEKEAMATLISLGHTLTHAQNVINYNLRGVIHHLQRAHTQKITYIKALEKVMQTVDLSQLKEVAELLDSRRHQINHTLLSSPSTNAASTEPRPAFNPNKPQ